MNKIKLASNYETLYKQASSMKMIIKSIEEQLNYYRQKDYNLSEKHLKYLEECLESEKEMNAILTEENEMLKTKLSHNSDYNAIKTAYNRKRCRKYSGGKNE